MIKTKWKGKDEAECDHIVNSAQDVITDSLYFHTRYLTSTEGLGDRVIR